MSPASPQRAAARRETTTSCPDPIRRKISTDGHWAKHAATWQADGSMLRRHGDPLRSVCAHCGAPIVRRHAKSAQWFKEAADAR